MSNPAVSHPAITADEYMDYVGDGDTRYELMDGVIKAMAPPAVPHGTIVANATAAMTRRLDGRPPCRPVVEAGIRIDDYRHYIADLAVTCTEPGPASYVEEPTLIVEVLSPSTQDTDLGVKLRRYIELPSVREIWLIDSRERWVQVWRREAAAWTVTMPLRGDAGFRSEFLDDTLGLDELYRNAGL